MGRSIQDLLGMLAGTPNDTVDRDQWKELVASEPDELAYDDEEGFEEEAFEDEEYEEEGEPEHVPAASAARSGESVDDLVARLPNIGKLTAGAAAPAPGPAAATTPPQEQIVRRGPPAAPPREEKPAAAPPSSAPDSDEWMPRAPAAIQETGLSEGDVEGVILKFLLNRPDALGRVIADQLRLPFAILEDVLLTMKQEQTVYYRGSAVMNDYVYALTELGREKARRLSEECTYFGAAPVLIADYIASVERQSLSQLHPSVADVRRAFSDLLLDEKLLLRLGPAVNSCRGLFLYGYPGNGKTSIAERITKTFGEVIWIPRSLMVDGEIIRLYDPVNHEEMPVAAEEGLIVEKKIDQRWIRIRRPTIIAGGELTMDQLEVSRSPDTGISEAPLQLKSNCGTLVIDDFGRQKMSTDQLLNRWIVPLEKRVDFLNLFNGKKLQVPFDQLVVFSTNLEPRDLVDEAFLRRIPYKINVPDPSEEDFRKLWDIMARQLGVKYKSEWLDYLIQKHYREVKRNLRGCHPRDLLTQIRNLCHYTRQPLEATPDNLDYAVDNYFSVT